MLNNDIIEKTHGPTEWLSPIVTPIKSGDPTKVRICVDNRRVNQAIIRDRHLTSTVEQLIHDLNDSVVFSKLDRNHAFWQIVISYESRYITTFSTPIGNFRFKRLNFGLNCSSEIFQSAMQQVLSGIPNVINICEDIF